MEKIEHTWVETNGIRMHVASIGSGPVVLFLHGFPELWYSWRHQLLSLSALGYRAIAPDLRGFGDTDAPPSASSYSALHIVGDIVGLLDALRIEQVFLVGHDWGASMAWYFCLLKPDRVKALVNMSVVFRPRNPKRKPVESLRAMLGDDYYICRFQKPGEVEEEFARAGTARIIKTFLASRDPRPPCVPKEIGFDGLPNTPIALPSWPRRRRPSVWEGDEDWWWRRRRRSSMDDWPPDIRAFFSKHAEGGDGRRRCRTSISR